MKSAFVAVALCAFACPAFAANPPPVWVGGFLVTDATGASCEQTSIQVNEMYTLVFHPKLTGDTTVATDVFQILTYQKAFQFIPKGGTRFQASGSYGSATWTARAIVKKFAGTHAQPEVPQHRRQAQQDRWLELFGDVCRRGDAEGLERATPRSLYRAS
jgi:hypothetical protein